MSQRSEDHQEEEMPFPFHASSWGKWYQPACASPSAPWNDVTPCTPVSSYRAQHHHWGLWRLMENGGAYTEEKNWRTMLLGLQSKNEDKKIIKILCFPLWAHTLLSFCSLIFAFRTQWTTSQLSFPRDWQVLYLPRYFLSASLQNHSSLWSGISPLLSM